MDPRVGRLCEDVTLFNRRIRNKGGSSLLTATQLQAMGHLDRIGPMNARMLAELESVAPQSIARTVLQLEAAGMVSRTGDPNDGRASLVSITETGRATLTEHRSRRGEWVEAAMAEQLTPVECEVLFIAGELLRRLASDTPGTGTAMAESR